MVSFNLGTALRSENAFQQNRRLQADADREQNERDAASVITKLNQQGFLDPSNKTSVDGDALRAALQADKSSPEYSLAIDSLKDLTKFGKVFRKQDGVEVSDIRRLEEGEPGYDPEEPLFTVETTSPSRGLGVLSFLRRDDTSDPNQEDAPLIFTIDDVIKRTSLGIQGYAVPALSDSKQSNYNQYVTLLGAANDTALALNAASNADPELANGFISALSEAETIEEKNDLSQRFLTDIGVDPKQFKGYVKPKAQEDSTSTATTTTTATTTLSDPQRAAIQKRIAT